MFLDSEIKMDRWTERVKTEIVRQGNRDIQLSTDK